MSGAQNDKRRNHFPPEAVRPTRDSGLGDRRVPQEGCFDLDGADPVSGDLDDLVGPPAEPVVAILVDGGGVAGKVSAGDAPPVVARVALGVAPDHRRQAWEGTRQHDGPLLARFASIPLRIADLGEDPRQRDSCRPGFDREETDPVWVAEDWTAGFRLPHVIDHRDPITEYVLLQPLPSRNVQRLPRADHA